MVILCLTFKNLSTKNHFYDTFMWHIYGWPNAGCFISFSEQGDRHCYEHHLYSIQEDEVQRGSVTWSGSLNTSMGTLASEQSRVTGVPILSDAVGHTSVVPRCFIPTARMSSLSCFLTPRLSTSRVLCPGYFCLSSIHKVWYMIGSQ